LARTSGWDAEESDMLDLLRGVLANIERMDG
jgi:hypothetical protein